MTGGSTTANNQDFSGPARPRMKYWLYGTGERKRAAF